MRKQVPHYGAVKLRRNLVGVEMPRLELTRLRQLVGLLGDARLRQRPVPLGGSDG